jgi:hypothetical protein
MSQFAFALFDLRRLVHFALAAAVLAMVHLYGSPSARAQLDAYLVTPVLRATETMGRHLGSSTVAVRAATKYFGWN